MKTKNKLKIILILILCILCLFMATACTPIQQDAEILKNSLLDPESLVIYNAYENYNYQDTGERASVFYFGAKNSFGGMTDDWVLIHGNNIQFMSDFENADSDKEALSYKEIVIAQFAIFSNDENWIEVPV